MMILDFSIAKALSLWMNRLSIRSKTYSKTLRPRIRHRWQVRYNIRGIHSNKDKINRQTHEHCTYDELQFHYWHYWGKIGPISSTSGFSWNEHCRLFRYLETKWPRRFRTYEKPMITLLFLTRKFELTLPSTTLRGEVLIIVHSEKADLNYEVDSFLWASSEHSSYSDRV